MLDNLNGAKVAVSRHRRIGRCALEILANESSSRNDRSFNVP